MVDKIQYVEREIRIPEQAFETKTVRVPRQRIVIEEEEVRITHFLGKSQCIGILTLLYPQHTVEAPAFEEYTVPVTTTQHVAQHAQHVAYQAAPTTYASYTTATATTPTAYSSAATTQFAGGYPYYRS